MGMRLNLVFQKDVKSISLSTKITNIVRQTMFQKDVKSISLSTDGNLIYQDE